MAGTSPKRKKQPREFSLDEIISIIHSTVKDALGSVEVEVFNGGDTLVKKSPWTAMTAISQDVREVRNDLKANTKQTEENTKLLADKKERADLFVSGKLFAQRIDKVFKIRKRWKIIIGLLGMYSIWHGAHDIPNILQNISEWFSKL